MPGFKLLLKLPELLCVALPLPHISNDMKRITILCLLCLVLAVAVHAQQKFGYVNSAELLASLPEVDAADAELETFQTQLISQGQEKVQAFEKNYNAYLEEVNQGLLSKVQMAEREKKLNKEQQAIAEFEKEVQLKVLQKREALLQPILNKVDEAIQAVGDEGGYSFIFDTSVNGAILHAPDTDNLINAIKAKLGVE